MLAAQVKEQVTLLQVAEQFEIPLHSGRQHCPFCDPGRAKSQSLVVRENGSGSFYCYRCKAEGDLFSLLIAAGKAPDFSGALKLVQPLCSGKATVVQERRSLLERIFQSYVMAAEFYPEAKEYLQGRGLNQSLYDYPFGYAPHSQWLQQNGFSWEDIEKVGLASKIEGIEAFSRRVVFPVRNCFGQLVHLQGRDISGESQVKYLFTGRKGTVSEVNTAGLLFCGEKLERWKEKYGLVFLCEGVPDTYSLLELGLPAVGCFGNRPELLGYGKQLEGMRVIACFDNDRWDLGTPDAGTYKSWPTAIPALLELQQHYAVEIECCPPPSAQGIKDVNKFLEKINFDSDRFLDYVERQSKPLFEFIEQEFGVGADYAPWILKAARFSRKPELREYVRSLYAENYEQILLELAPCL